MESVGEEQRHDLPLTSFRASTSNKETRDGATYPFSHDQRGNSVGL